MDFVLRNAYVYKDNTFNLNDVLIKDNRVFSVCKNISCESSVVSLNFNNCIIIPGLTDVHVHLREPGFSFKETIATGTAAAAHGGYTTVCAMPNLSPVPDNAESLGIEKEKIEKDALIHVVPYGAITCAQSGEKLSEMEEMSEFVAGFSDDGRGVQKDGMMLKAMKKAKALGKIIAAHCEDNSLLNNGYIHDGKYAALHSHRGISSESEWKQIERDLKLAKETGCKYHVCHISTKESVSLIRKAKADGVDVSCETAPHYLVLDENDLKEDGRFKMNPPLRSTEDRLALLEGIKDGTIDMIATDHAPHTKEEKSRGLEKSLMGVVGLETAFPVLYTELVKKNVISLEKLVELMSVNPSARFGFRCGITEGEKANLTVISTQTEKTVNTDEFLSMGRSTPFEGRKVYGETMMTVCDGKIVYKNKCVKN